MRADQIIEADMTREQSKPELARQARQNRSKAADGGVHAVSHTVHSTRAQEVEDGKDVVKPPKKRWQRATALAGIAPPPGFRVKWARIDGQHRGDQSNLIRHLQEGWEFAKPSDFAKKALPTHRLTNHGEVIGNVDTVLLKMEEELVEQRNAFYNSRRDVATQAINQESGLSEALHPAMPLVEDINRSRVKFQRMRRKQRESVGVKDDD